jgi:hypothetical protein
VLNGIPVLSTVQNLWSRSFLFPPEPPIVVKLLNS